MGIAGLNCSMVWDISAPLVTGRMESPVPGVASFEREIVARLPLPDGAVAELSKFTMTAHTGTHIDMPAHFFPEGRRIDDYDVSNFILPAQVVDVSDPEAVRLAHVAGLTISRGEALLFRTRNSEPSPAAQNEAHPDHVYLTPEVADHCVAHGVRLVGVDCHAPERLGEAVEAAPIHRRLLGNGVLILEGLNLRGVPPGRYVLLCLPLNIPGAEGSPVRAVLLA